MKKKIFTFLFLLSYAFPSYAMPMEDNDAPSSIHSFSWLSAVPLEEQIERVRELNPTLSHHEIEDALSSFNPLPIDSASCVSHWGNSGAQ